MIADDLRFEFQWEASDSQEAESCTWGTLWVATEDEYLWGTKAEGVPKGLRWTWVELLEHLAEIWPWLLWEERWPFGLWPKGPTELAPLANDYLSRLTLGEAKAAESTLFEFRHRHDLAMAVNGKLLPSLWLVREGRRMWISSPGFGCQLPLDAVLACLNRLGEEIANRLRGLTDDRAAGALADWDARDERSPLAMASIATGIDEDSLEALSPAGFTETFGLCEGAQFELTEALAVARMAFNKTTPDVVGEILETLRHVSRVDASTLDDWSRRAVESCQHEGELGPQESGKKLAVWLRAQLNLGPGDRADPEDVIGGLFGLPINDLRVRDKDVEALACWGPDHGPAVLVNSQGRFSSTTWGRRVTLAHELLHLLVDRRGALPLAEVLGGSVSKRLEQRANVFAAEFLLPESAARAAFEDSADPHETLTELASQYCVGHEVVAWQTNRSGARLSDKAFLFLKSLVSQPQRFRRHTQT